MLLLAIIQYFCMVHVSIFERVLHVYTCIWVTTAINYSFHQLICFCWSVDCTAGTCRVGQWFNISHTLQYCNNHIAWFWTANTITMVLLQLNSNYNTCTCIWSWKILVYLISSYMLSKEGSEVSSFSLFFLS